MATGAHANGIWTIARRVFCQRQQMGESKGDAFGVARRSFDAPAARFAPTQICNNPGQGGASFGRSPCRDVHVGPPRGPVVILPELIKPYGSYGDGARAIWRVFCPTCDTPRQVSLSGTIRYATKYAELHLCVDCGLKRRSERRLAASNAPGGPPREANDAEAK